MSYDSRSNRKSEIGDAVLRKFVATDIAKNTRLRWRAEQLGLTAGDMINDVIIDLLGKHGSLENVPVPEGLTFKQLLARNAFYRLGEVTAKSARRLETRSIYPNSGDGRSSASRQYEDENAPSPDAGLIASEKVKAVRKAIRRLSPSLQDVVRLRNMESHSFAGVAQMLGITPEAARARHSRAMRHLRRQLASTCN